MSLRFHLLAHTRSKSFDYSWVRGLADQGFENELSRFLQSWLDNVQLDKLSPVTAFFPFRKRCVLLSAYKSETRKDGVNRPIFERALLVWDGQEKVRYSHLLPLLRILGRHAGPILSSVPDNVLEPPREPFAFDLDWDDLEEPQRGRDTADRWSLPFGLTPQELARTGLIVEVPAEWDFAKMLAPLGDAVIELGEIVSVGQGLTFKHRCEIAGGWLVSAPKSEPVREPRVRDAAGQVLEEPAVRQRRQEAERSSKGKTSRPEMPVPPAAAPAPAEAPGNPWDLEEAVYMSQRIAESQKQETWFRRGSPDGLVSVVRRVHYLVSPVGRLVGQDVLTAWHLFLEEILLSHSVLSPGMADEWMRRLNTLRRFVTHRDYQLDPRWLGDFNNACDALYKALDQARYR